MPFDTSPAMIEAQIRLYREIGPEGRGRIAAEMSDIAPRTGNHDEEQVLAAVLDVLLRPPGGWVSISKVLENLRTALDSVGVPYMVTASRRADRAAIFSTLSQLDRALLHLCPSVRAEQIL
jgi:hypothetical protein